MIGLTISMVIFIVLISYIGIVVCDEEPYPREFPVAYAEDIRTNLPKCLPTKSTALILNKDSICFWKKRVIIYGNALEEYDGIENGDLVDYKKFNKKDYSLILYQYIIIELDPRVETFRTLLGGPACYFSKDMRIIRRCISIIHLQDLMKKIGTKYQDLFEMLTELCIENDIDIKEINDEINLQIINYISVYPSIIELKNPVMVVSYLKTDKEDILITVTPISQVVGYLDAV